MDDGVALPRGWFYDEYSNRLCRGRDRTSIPAAYINPAEWPRQIADFEFREGAQWTPGQIATMKGVEVEYIALASKDPWLQVVDPDGTVRKVPLGPRGPIRATEEAQKVADWMDAWAKGDMPEPMVQGIVARLNRVPDSPGGDGEVTDTMRAAADEARALHQLGVFAGDVSMDEVIYRAMHAVAPVELISEGERQADQYRRERDNVLDIATATQLKLNDAAARIAVLEATIVTYQKQGLERFEREARVMAEEPGDHPYHGPTETVPHPTIDGQSVKQAVPDPVHEQFHRAVGDVLAGRVMKPALRQMQEALKNCPKEKAPFPLPKLSYDPRKMGL